MNIRISLNRSLRQTVTERLEFSAFVGELSLKGIDLIRLGEDGRIVEFEVMIRPAYALLALGEEMGKRLAALGIKA